MFGQKTAFSVKSQRLPTLHIYVPSLTHVLISCRSVILYTVNKTCFLKISTKLNIRLQDVGELSMLNQNISSKLLDFTEQLHIKLQSSYFK